MTPSLAIKKIGNGWDTLAFFQASRYFWFFTNKLSATAHDTACFEKGKNMLSALLTTAEIRVISNKPNLVVHHAALVQHVGIPAFKKLHGTVEVAQRTRGMPHGRAGLSSSLPAVGLQRGGLQRRRT